MTQEAYSADALVALAWLRDNPRAAEGARQRVAIAGKKLPDALLEDPTRIVDLLAEAVVESMRSGVPPGVAEQMLVLWRFTTAVAGGFDADSYAAREIAGMQGLRGADEFNAALAVSAANAPDEASSAAVERLRLAADRAIDLGPRFLGPDGTSTEPVDTGAGSTVDPGTGSTVEPDAGSTVDPGMGSTVDPGAGSTVDSATGGSGEPGGAFGGLTGDAGVDAAAQLGAIVGGHVGGADGATQGAALGAQLAGSGHAAPSHSTASNLWTGWGAQLGGAVGSAVLGPAGQVIGSEFGALVGGQMSGHGHDAATLAVDLASAAACLLCGSVLCLPCVLAAETAGEWLVSHIKALFAD